MRPVCVCVRGIIVFDFCVNTREDSETGDWARGAAGVELQVRGRVPGSCRFLLPGNTKGNEYAIWMVFCGARLYLLLSFHLQFWLLEHFAVLLPGSCNQAFYIPGVVRFPSFHECVSVYACP